MLATVLEFSAARLESLETRHGTATIWRISLTPCLVARGHVLRVVTMPVKSDCACLDERTVVKQWR
jgi:hypothetical protein